MLARVSWANREDCAHLPALSLGYKSLDSTGNCHRFIAIIMCRIGPHSRVLWAKRNSYGDLQAWS